MPTYEYECKSCGHNFEVFQSMSEEPLKTCVKCGKEVRRLIFGGAGVIFKGSGFYVTDKGNGTKVPGKTPAGKTSRAAKTESTTAEKSPPAQSPPAVPTTAAPKTA
jgi:putative FmdB family regulatory protein